MAELQRAFISPNMISMESRYILAVVQAARHPDNDLVIAISPIYPPEMLATLRVVIDRQDLAEVQKLLGEERPVLPMAWEDDLAIARGALEKIAVLFEKDEEDTTSWKGMALEAIQLAQHALEKIASQEVNDGTPSDS